MPEFYKGTFAQFVELLQLRMAQDHDNVIAIDGYEGLGKSTLALQLARAVQPDFPLYHCMFSSDDYSHQFLYRKRRIVYLFDEGGNLIFSRDAMTKDQKKLIRIMTQARQLNNTLIFVMPNLFWMDKYVREHRVKWWIHVERRGEAVLLERAGRWKTGEYWYEETGSIFRFKPLSKTDPAFWAEYLKRKHHAFESQDLTVQGPPTGDILSISAETRAGRLLRPGPPVAR